MSDNALATLLNSGNMPSYVKDGEAAKETNKEAIQGAGGESVNRISLKQSRFRLVVGGEQVRVFDEPYMNVVVVRANPGTSRAFYKNKYDPNAEDQMPTCFSDDGVHPNPDAREKQSVSCQNCPMNQWGSKISEVSGKKIKACGEVKRLGIVPASNPSAPAFQLNVPTASLTTWANYVRKLNQASPAVPYNGVVTKVSFDPESDHPKLEFEPISWLSDEQYATIQERYHSDEIHSVATLTENPAPDPKDVIATDAQPAQTEPAQQQATQQTQPAETEEERQAREAEEARKKAQEEAAAAWGGGGAAEQAQDTPAETDNSGWGGDAAQQTQSAASQEQAAQQGAGGFDPGEAKEAVGDSLDEVFGAGWDD